MAFPSRSALLLFIALSIGPARAEGLDALVGQFRADDEDLSSIRVIPWNAETLQREEGFISSWEQKLGALDYASLDATSRIDWHLLGANLKQRRADLQLARNRAGGTASILSFMKPVEGLLLAHSRRQLANPEKSAAAINAAIAALKETRKELKPGKDANGTPRIPPAVALRAADSISQLAGRLKSWYGFYDGFQSQFGWWVRKPHDALAAEMTSFAAYLRKDIAGIKGEAGDPLIGDPIGGDAIRAGLQTEMIPYTAEELISLAEKEFAWCEGEMKKAASDLGCANGAEAIAKIKEKHAPPGGQAALVVAEADKAIRFLKEKDLVTIPPLAEEIWGLSMATPEQQKNLPYVAYHKPDILMAYASESMAHDDKIAAMRANNAAFLHIITPHELIPGHHLQFFMARRHAAYREAFETPFLVEGWALHWEMLLWDQGYLATPEEKVGALFWRMHRCARVIVSLKFHLGEMTPPQMIDFLVDRVGHERAAATAEVRRYISGGYGPLYQVAYMIGGLQLGALQKELTAPGPGNTGAKGKLTLRDFHDRILRLGPIPIEMIRASLKKESLPKEWKPEWRFAD